MDFNSAIKDIFELQESDKLAFDNLSEELIHKQMEFLRSNLDASAKKCSIYDFLMKYFEDEINKISTNSHDDYSTKKWLSIIKMHKGIYDLIGNLTLLQMDAMTTCISLFQATNDTERIILCKHAYTIIYEALEHNLFKRVACDMRKYPKELITNEELDKLWQSVKKSLKEISEKKKSKQIRNNIDAHKSDLFIEQINAYKMCKWSQSIINLYILIQVIDNIQNCMYSINKNIDKLLEQFKVEMEERIKNLDNIREFLQQSDETFSNSK